VNAVRSSILAEFAENNPVRIEDLADVSDSRDARELLDAILTTSRDTPSGMWTSIARLGMSAVSGRTGRKGGIGIALAAVIALVLVIVLPGQDLRPSDAGTSWRLVSSVSSPFRSLPPGGQIDLQCVTDVACYSPGFGSHGGELYRTNDGGQSWYQTTQIPMRLDAYFSFSCSSAETCAVISSPAHLPVGGLAELAITNDGGATWSTSTIPSPAGISDAYVGSIVCVNGMQCVASVGGSPASVGEAGTFLATTDGGRTWTQATSVPAAAMSVRAMTCTSEGSCLAVSISVERPSAIVGLSSHDWGRTWVAGAPAAFDEGPLAPGVSCADATHCMVVSRGTPGRYQIAVTSDAGLTWRVSGPPSGWLNMPTEVSCATGNDCWIALSDYDSDNPAGAYSHPDLEETHDGGRTWSSISLPPSKPPIADLLTLSCPPTGDGCMGIGNRQDHFVRPKTSNGRRKPLSGPLVISDLPQARS
jgi:photosystem II stability/assembly factor-like uncharacterized protein